MPVEAMAQGNVCGAPLFLAVPAVAHARIIPKLESILVHGGVEESVCSVFCRLF
jgi:hypothetical protein